MKLGKNDWTLKEMIVENDSRGDGAIRYEGERKQKVCNEMPLITLTTADWNAVEGGNVNVTRADRPLHIGMRRE